MNSIQQRKIKRHFVTFVYDYFVWLFAGAIYLLVRFYGTKENVDWAQDSQSLYFLWLLSAFSFSIIFWIANFISEMRVLRTRAFWFLFSMKMIILLFGCLVILMMSRFFAFFQGTIEFGQILPSFTSKLTENSTQVFFLYVFTVSGLFNFYNQMRVMIGGRILKNLMLGKYHHPKEEKRIFMFLDLKGSTTHGEKLGHIIFSELIQDCFRDLTDAAIKHQVEIYQYVGDEAVLTWTIEEGLEDSNCLMTFFEFQKSIQDNQDYYQEKYGFVPEFKAGVNMGMVTVAEVGVLKRDISYHSDVLNTAARIEGKCNDYEKNLLISGELKSNLEKSDNLSFELLGTLPLKGKENKVDIYHVSCTES